jgi:hypothetical protein
MNMNPGHFTTYKSLSPVLRTQTTCLALPCHREINEYTARAILKEAGGTEP